MNTANFSVNNAKHYYAFGMNVYFDKETIEENELEDVNEGDFDEVGTEFAFEDGIANCASLLKEKGWQECEGRGSDESCEFMEKTECVSFHGVEYRITMNAVYRCGYYEGAVFDYDLSMEEFYGDRYNGMYDELPTLSDICDVMTYRIGRPRRRTKETEYYQAKQLEKMVTECVENMVDEVESAFEQACDVKLGVSACFGNGEV